MPEAEEMAKISIQLAARFLFSTGFHTKKAVRGPASDWYVSVLEKKKRLGSLQWLLKNKATLKLIAHISFFLFLFFFKV